MNLRKLFCFDTSASCSDLVNALRAKDWDVYVADRLDEAKNILESQDFDIGIMVFGSRDQADLAPIENLLSMQYPMEWVGILQAHSLQSRETCQLIAQGFYDYHTLPVDIDRLNPILGHAYGMAQIMKKLHNQPNVIVQEGMVGCSTKYARLINDISVASSLDVPVLLSGETGSGREMSARAIHRRSSRTGRPFIIVSCGALSPNLMHAELFGYEQGALPGANRSKIGCIESASGGTLFLNGLENLHPSLWQPMLDFLHNHSIVRMGSSTPVHVDTRVLSSTSIDLAKVAESGKFSTEVLEALSPLKIQVPNLRERQEDIDLLAKYFLDLYTNEKYQKVSGFTPEAITAMHYHEWRGNIQELINRVRRAIVMCEDRLIAPVDLGFTETNAMSMPAMLPSMNLEQAKSEAEKNVIQATLRAVDHNISRAARELGVSRMTLYRLMDKHHIRSGGEQAVK